MMLRLKISHIVRQWSDPERSPRIGKNNTRGCKDAFVGDEHATLIAVAG
jgi:hypothetical protein